MQGLSFALPPVPPSGVPGAAQLRQGLSRGRRTTRSKKLLGTKGIATRSKDATPHQAGGIAFQGGQGSSQLCSAQLCIGRIPIRHRGTVLRSVNSEQRGESEGCYSALIHPSCKCTGNRLDILRDSWHIRPQRSCLWVRGTRSRTFRLVLSPQIAEAQMRPITRLWVLIWRVETRIPWFTYLGGQAALMVLGLQVLTDIHILIYS